MSNDDTHFKGSYAYDKAKKQKLLKEKNKRYNELGKWLEKNSTMNAEWDDKVNEYYQLHEQIPILESQIKQSKPLFNNKNF